MVRISEFYQKLPKIFLPSIVLQVPFIDIFYHTWALRGVTYVNANIWALMIIDVYLEPCMTNSVLLNALI